MIEGHFRRMINLNSIIFSDQNNYLCNCWWKLTRKIKGFQEEFGYNLITEIDRDRIFRVIDSNLSREISFKNSRILVQLYEDGYICWVNVDEIFCEEFDISSEKLFVRDEEFIQAQIPFILDWISNQSLNKNKYLWGGTVGPDYDCSGLIQTAFLKHNIFIPRDSYQMKDFSRHLFNFPGNIDNLKMGDLLFFGNKVKCNHVAIYFKDGLYFHSSGKTDGRDGISLDSLVEYKDSISLNYFSKLISAGRVTRSYKWNKTIR